MSLLGNLRGMLPRWLRKRIRWTVDRVLDLVYRDRLRLFNIRVRSPGFDKRIRIYLDLSVRGQRLLFLSRVYEPLTTRYLVEFLEEGMTFVDVGAHIGYFTLLGASRVGRPGRVIAFEPFPENRERLLSNIVVNGLDNVTISGYALSGRRREGKLYSSTDPSTHSLGQPFEGFYKRKGIGAAGDHVTVECITFDEARRELRIDNVDVVKIDVEGAEMGVIQGMADTIRKCGDLRLLCDVHPNKFPAFGHDENEFRRLILSMFDVCLLIKKQGLLSVDAADPSEFEGQYSLLCANVLPDCYLRT